MNMEPKNGWITYGGVRSVRVQVLGKVGGCYRVRFPTKKLGLKGHVGAVPRGSVSFDAPHLNVIG